MGVKVMFVKGKGLVAKYENGSYVASIFESSVPQEPTVKEPKVIVLEVNDGVALLAQQITPSVYKKIGFANTNFLLTYEGNKMIPIQPGSAVHKALMNYRKAHPSIEDLCKA